MKSAVFVLVFWFSFSEKPNLVSANTSKAMQTFLVNLVTLEHANNTRDNVNITENVMASTITDLQTLLQNKDRQIYLNNEQYLKFINILRENIAVKNQENIRLQNILDNLTETITNHRIETVRKDGQFQDNNEQVRAKEIKDLIEQINNKHENQEIIRLQNRLENLTEVITNYRIEAERKDGKIEDLREQIKDKLKNQEIIQNRLDNLTEVIMNYRIEISLKDSQIQDYIEQLKAMDTQINTKDNEIKVLREQIKSTQSISEKLNLTNDELATYKYTEQCPNLATISYFQFKIRGINTFQARCNPSGWMVIQVRYNGSENFNRSWNEYKEGFGTLRAEFFFGLEKLHLMTAARTYELYISLKDNTGNTSYAHYSDFKIGSEEESYRLKSVGKYSGTAGPSLDYHVQSNFSTFDRDFTDGNGLIGCVSNNGGGWWYKDCGFSSLNGFYFKKTNPDIQNKYIIFWVGFRGIYSNTTLTESVMMIKPTTL